MFWPFFNRFSSNFHPPPNFWYWSQNPFQNWLFSLFHTYNTIVYIFQAENLVFVENPTTGINAVMSSLSLSPDDAILMYSHTYNAVKNTAWASGNKSGGAHTWFVPSILKQLSIQQSTISVFQTFLTRLKPREINVI